MIMRLAWLLVATIHALDINQMPLGNCTKIYVRKEFRDLTKNEWNAYKEAMFKLQDTPSRDGGAYSEWDRITSLHVQNGHKFHGTRHFMHWHRTLTAAFEKALQRINPNVSIPYWDYSHDWRFPEKSPIMTPDYGIDVYSSVNVTTGDCRFKRHFPKPHCLARGYTPGKFPQLPSDDYVNLVVSNVRDYGRFSEFLEKGIHNPVHVALSGEMNTPEAPNDPIFWSLHAFVDKIWCDWNDITGAGLNSTELTRIMDPFNVTAGDVQDTLALCYDYQPFSQARKFPPTKIPR